MKKLPWHMVAVGAAVLLVITVLGFIVWAIVADLPSEATASKRPRFKNASSEPTSTKNDVVAASSRTANGLWCYVDPKEGEENSSKSPASKPVPRPAHESPPAEYCMPAPAIDAGPAGSACLTRRDCVVPLSCIDNICGTLQAASQPAVNKVENPLPQDDEDDSPLDVPAIDPDDAVDDESPPDSPKKAPEKEVKKKIVETEPEEVPGLISPFEPAKSSGKKCSKAKECTVPGETCQSKKCTLRKCESDKECSPVSYCNADAGVCQAKSCTADKDCGKGASCILSQHYCLRAKK